MSWNPKCFKYGKRSHIQIIIVFVFEDAQMVSNKSISRWATESLGFVMYENASIQMLIRRANLTEDPC